MYVRRTSGICNITLRLVVAFFHYIIRSVLSDHVDEILKYAGKHGHLDLIDEMTPFLLRKPLDEMEAFLTDDLFKRWVITILHSVFSSVDSYIRRFDITSGGAMSCNMPFPIQTSN
jgi:hypothetical protein